MENRFNNLAKIWDTKPQRVEGAMIFVDKIKENLETNLENMKLLDYGCGSGLVSFGFSNDVSTIVGLDNSQGMVDVYNEKSKTIGLSNIEAMLHNIDHEDLEENSFDIIVTNMTMHHIKNVNDFVSKLAKSLKKDGKLFIADLYKEDGTFHSDNTGVVHFGFELDDVKNSFEKANLDNIEISKLQTIDKPTKSYDVFFAVGTKI